MPHISGVDTETESSASVSAHCRELLIATCDIESMYYCIKILNTGSEAFFFLLLDNRGTIYLKCRANRHRATYVQSAEAKTPNLWGACYRFVRLFVFILSWRDAYSLSQIRNKY